MKYKEAIKLLENVSKRGIVPAANVWCLEGTDNWDLLETIVDSGVIDFQGEPANGIYVNGLGDKVEYKNGAVNEKIY